MRGCDSLYGVPVERVHDGELVEHVAAVECQELGLRATGRSEDRHDEVSGDRVDDVAPRDRHRRAGDRQRVSLPRFGGQSLYTASRAAFNLNSNSMGLTYPIVECIRMTL
jgi:hypothetical protein